MQNTDNKCITNFWFVAKTRANQELSIKRHLDGFGIENFVPVRSEVRMYSGRKRMVQKVQIPNIVFVHSTKEQAYSLINERCLKLSFMIDKHTRKTMIVPEKQMCDFMRVFAANNAEELQISTTTTFAKGDKVQIMEGVFCGVEGELMWINGKSQVRVQIPGVVAITLHVSKKSLRKI
ncbi:MAG: UpxY family transcription antiterminator [Bacteroidales bacterium]|jgi:transcription antitermination factor NusG|nr:UpxY family transcription antiterminator [Bacteroidales bacterium]